MLSCRRALGYVVLAFTLFQWKAGNGFQPAELPEQVPLGPGSASPSRGDKSATELATKLLLLDELMSLENDAIETKKKRSFSGFGAPLDRLSATSVDLKTKQRKVVELPKRRFGLPLDRIGTNRLSNTRGLPALAEALSRKAATTEGTLARSTPLSAPRDVTVKRQAS